MSKFDPQNSEYTVRFEGDRDGWNHAMLMWVFANSVARCRDFVILNRDYLEHHQRQSNISEMFWIALELCNPKLGSISRLF